MAIVVPLFVTNPRVSSRGFVPKTRFGRKSDILEENCPYMAKVTQDIQYA